MGSFVLALKYQSSANITKSQQGSTIFSGWEVLKDAGMFSLYHSHKLYNILENILFLQINLDIIYFHLVLSIPFSWKKSLKSLGGLSFVPACTCSSQKKEGGQRVCPEMPPFAGSTEVLRGSKCVSFHNRSVPLDRALNSTQKHKESSLFSSLLHNRHGWLLPGHKTMPCVAKNTHNWRISVIWFFSSWSTSPVPRKPSLMSKFRWGSTRAGNARKNRCASRCPSEHIISEFGGGGIPEFLCRQCEHLGGLKNQVAKT